MKEFIIEYWIEVLFGGVVTGILYTIRGIKRKMKENESIKLGVQALLRNSIIQQYNHYEEQGFIPIYARENLDALSKEYYNLGGNGVVHQLMDKLAELPTNKDE